MEKSENERALIWKNLNECMTRFGEEERLVVLGDINAKVGDRDQDGVVGKLVVPGVNENGKCLVEICAERGLIFENTWFKKKVIHKYTWEREHEDEKNLIDYVVTERNVSVHEGL